MSRKIILIQGSVAAIDIEQQDPTATSASIYMKNEDTDAVISKTASYVDGVATIEFDGEDTSVVGVYPFQVNENLPDGIAKYGAEDCDGDGDCEFGVIIICEALDGGIS